MEYKLKIYPINQNSFIGKIDVQEDINVNERTWTSYIPSIFNNNNSNLFN